LNDDNTRRQTVLETDLLKNLESCADQLIESHAQCVQSYPNFAATHYNPSLGTLDLSGPNPVYNTTTLISLGLDNKPGQGRTRWR
jgi:hypothetical protein